MNVAEAEGLMLCVGSPGAVLPRSEEEEEYDQGQFGKVEVVWGEGECSAVDVKEELERHWADTGR